MSTTYAGIDYGLGKSNINRETGIRYGVISQNSVNPDALSDVEYDYGKPACPECGDEIKASDDVSLFADFEGELDEDGTPEWFNGMDYACIKCKKCFWGDNCFSDEPLGFTYSRDGYELADCLDNDIFVLNSPYYTFAQFCSPCVPGAGNLDSTVPVEAGPKTYCLGPDWFDEYNPMPYRCYRVSDDTEVTA